MRRVLELLLSDQWEVQAVEDGRSNDFLVKLFSERELIVKMKAQLESAALRAAESAPRARGRGRQPGRETAGLDRSSSSRGTSRRKR